MSKKNEKKEVITDEMRAAILHNHFSKLGKKGGKSRTDSMTPEARKRLARKAARARWKKQKGESE
jgi:hypothetical protein